MRLFVILASLTCFAPSLQAPIGGTNSQLGVFRLDRDVLRHRPDLVFLDFSANDGIMSADLEKLASYESLVRRIILDAQAPVVQVVFPFMRDVRPGTTDGMKRRDAHHAIARAYNTAIGDAITLCQQRVKNGEATLEGPVKRWQAIADRVRRCSARQPR